MDDKQKILDKIYIIYNELTEEKKHRLRNPDPKLILSELIIYHDSHKFSPEGYNNIYRINWFRDLPNISLPLDILKIQLSFIKSFYCYQQHGKNEEFTIDPFTV